METHSLRAADGLVLNCLDYGGRGFTPILFVHGGSAHAHWWDFVAPALTDRFHVLALDQRGHGESPWTPEWAYGTRDYVADLKAIITSWGFGAPVLIGHSMGGHNVLVYAGLHSDTLRAAVAIDSPATYPPYALKALRDLADRPSRGFDSLDEACANFRTIPDVSTATAEVMRHVALHSFRQDPDGKWRHKIDRRAMIREPIDAWPLFGEIQCPVLFARAANSVIKDGHAEKMVAAMRNGRFTIVPDSHHHVLLDNPSGLITALRKFLAEVI
jgi:pimeloyl-ACP methyl ester carboxylesterase